MTKIEAYQRACLLLKQAQPLLDQAAVLLRRAGVHAQAGGYRAPTALNLASDLESLEKNVSDAHCEDCDARLDADPQCDCGWRIQEVNL